MAEEQARSEGREILGFVEGFEFASVPPGDGLLMAPALAVPRLLQRRGLSVADIDLFEIHEAFAAQLLCTVKVWESGWVKYPGQTQIGVIPEERINVWGGSVALGHPFAATGGRLLLNACYALRERGQRRCVISVCAAGGGGAAVLVSAAN
jgi:acetyl-CoA acetyltransferase